MVVSFGKKWAPKGLKEYGACRDCVLWMPMVQLRLLSQCQACKISLFHFRSFLPSLSLA